MVVEVHHCGSHATEGSQHLKDRSPEMRDDVSIWVSTSCTLCLSHQSGAVCYFHERGRPVFDENDVPLYIDGVIFDVTENKEAVIKHQELEKQLRQAQKLEALGALAGGITHDFNNILSSIYGYSQLALLELPEDNTVRTYLKDMHAAANRLGVHSLFLVFFYVLVCYAKNELHALVPAQNR